jgi:hypothetical protein
MKASILPLYLVGSRRAILELAGSRWTPFIGMLFVLSAGLAREYDGEDLVHEPWHALRPLGASLASGTLLFLIVHLAALLKQHKASTAPPPFFRAWWTFLGLFWLTAPMAWLYAIPYERFMTPVDAIAVNLWTLAGVAVWRVLLMTRVIRVLYGFGRVASFLLVMLFADAVVFAAVTLAPTPVIDVMGGIRHSDRDALIASVTISVMMLSILTAPVWIAGALVALGTLRPKWADLEAARSRTHARGLVILAIASIVAFVPLLVVSQPEQMNRREAEVLLSQGRVGEAFALMSARAPGDYPPHWNPPPKIGYGETLPSVRALREAMSSDWPADWVASIYLDKIERGLRNEVMPYWSSASWEELVSWLEEQREYHETDPEHRVTARFLVDHHAGLSEGDRAALARLAEAP